MILGLCMDGKFLQVIDIWKQFVFFGIFCRYGSVFIKINIFLCRFLKLYSNFNFFFQNGLGFYIKFMVKDVMI